MSKKTIPAISVVIPMYNAEKYIGECLDSILAQTFDDYEVIVVDDCSTDNSAAVVESYIQKFNDKLQLVRLKINSGGAGTPRNMGLKFSRGEYLLFVDSDDIISKTALDELYTAAKNFQADVVSCEKWYQTPVNGNVFDKNSLKIAGLPINNQVTQPTLADSDIAQRVRALYQLQFTWSIWTKFIRREVILENDLSILNVGDTIFTCCLICSDIKYVRIPNIFYTYRIHDDSTFHRQETVSSAVQKWSSAFANGFNYLNNFLSKQDFFKQHPDLKYIALETVVREFANYLIKIYSQVPAYQLNEIVKQELEKISDKTALAAFLFGRMNIFNFQIIQQQNAIRQLQAQVQQLQAQRPPIPQPQPQPQFQQQNQKYLQLNQSPMMEFRINTEDIYRR
ncbi:MAG: glycosyltransferase [Selenomonadaceae bacterium]|nr:glycosyltransferase [Selenomonadaceae bacterium]